MASKAKAKALADDFDDDEVASMLELDTPVPPDPEQWVRDENGDLDWAYTSRTVRKLSHDALLTHLWEKSFSIPPREYNPSAPFVWVKLHSGDTVRLPHGYRLPLMFVAKYRWEMTLAKVRNERLWKQERANIFHLSRLCENLFRRAQAKASRGGMEKGWRCVMFDRLLARFYKHWSRNDPEGGKGFLKTHGSKEYDRDVLKHDWKRWCLRGLNGVQMIEEEVTHGITIENFRKGLRKTDDGVWMLDDRPLLHITDEEPQAYSSSSDLTDFSFGDGNPSDDEGEGDEVPDEAPSDVPNDDFAMQTDTPADAHSKRPRDLPVDEDEIERETKRTRIENHLEAEEVVESPRSDRPRRIGRLTRTLAAMARNPTLNPVPPGRPPRPCTASPSTDVNAVQPENAFQEAPPDLSSLATVDPSLLVATHIHSHTLFLHINPRDKYPWPPALGVDEPRSHSETRMFQECTAPDTWDLDDGSIAWRAAGTLAWSDEKVWRAAARAATSEEALRLAQAAASTAGRRARPRCGAAS
ncbi:hypothetical protein BJ912DRAFT_1054512 [Pholiota molesta]|nr:hypothetical protein BJ912DRAFT_1054512 [Pholiota molesta]